MTEFENQYEQFQLTAAQCENLRRLIEPPLQTPRTTDRVIIETVVIDDGKRRFVKKEAQCAKLV